MPNNDEAKTVNIKISEVLIKKETEDKIKTRVPRTYDDKERYLILNQMILKKSMKEQHCLLLLKKIRFIILLIK